MLGSCIELLQKVITTCSLRVAVDEDEAIDHRWPPMGKSDENVGPEADREPDKVRDPEVVADVCSPPPRLLVNWRLAGGRGKGTAR